MSPRNAERFLQMLADREPVIAKALSTKLIALGFPPKVVPLEAVFIMILWECS